MGIVVKYFHCWKREARVHRASGMYRDDDEVSYAPTALSPPIEVVL